MKTAVITGATSGIGHACMLRFAKEGFRVIGIGRDQQRLDEVSAASLKAGAASCLMIKSELASSDACQKIAGAMTQEQSIDALVNCAGIAYEGGFESIEPKEWDEVFQVNVTTPFFLIKVLMPWLERAESAAIVNVSSIAGRSRSISLGCHYSTSKAALIGMTRHLAAELGPRGMRINCTAPSQTHTPMLEEALSPEARGTLAEKVPLKRLGEANEQADVIFYLCSSASSYINGSIIDVNGGLL